MLTRRNVFAFGAAGGIAGLTGCTFATSGATTTVVVDIPKIVTDGKAVVAAATAILGAPAFTAVLTVAEVNSINLALSAINAGLTALDAYTNDSNVTLTLDLSTIQSTVTTVLSNVQTIVGIVQSVLGKMAGSVVTTVENYIAAILALVPFVQIAAGLAKSNAVMSAPMSEDAAVATAYGIPHAQARLMTVSHAVTLAVPTKPAM